MSKLSRQEKLSSINNRHSKKDLVPVTDSDIFYGHEEERFALGVYSPQQIESYAFGSIPQAYLQLRSNVYTKRGFLDGKSVRFDGTEMDNHDHHSVHFMMIENLDYENPENFSRKNTISKMGRIAVFSCMRMIINTESKEIPAKSFYPEYFKDKDTPRAIEISRVIAAHDDSDIRTFAQGVLFTAGLAKSINENLGPVYGVVERHFAQGLKMSGVPVEPIAELKYLEEYNSENLLIEIDKEEFARRVGSEILKKMTIPVGSFTYWSDILGQNNK